MRGRGRPKQAGVPKLGQLGTAAEVLAAHREHGARFREMDLAAAWNSLGRLLRRSATCRRQLGSPTESAALLAPLAEQTLQQLPAFPGRAVANTAHGLASVETRTKWRAEEALWGGLAARGVAVVGELNPQELANTAWAYTTAGRPAPALYDALATEAAARVRTLNPQGIANLAWAFARAGRAAPRLFDVMAAEAVLQIDEFNAQDLANTAWAYAKVGYPAGALFDTIAAAAPSRVGEFNAQALANTAWAYATAGHPAPALFDAIAAAAPARVGDFSPQALANTAWAFAKAGRPAPALYDAIAAAALGSLAAFTPQALANLAWAYATAGHASPALYDAIASEWVERIATGKGGFNQQDLANTAWAYATARHATPALLDAIGGEAAERIDTLSAQALANTAWACAVVDADGAALNALFRSPKFVNCCAAHEALGAFGAEALRQLHQWQLWRDERVERGEAGGASAWPPLPPELAARCRAAFTAEEGRPSMLQRQVEGTLAAIGLPPRSEVLTPLGYSLDAVIEVGGSEVAVEVDGPTHFVGQTPTGATALKRRQLRAAGWSLVVVPYWEWNALGRDNDEAREVYMRRALSPYVFDALSEV